MSFGPLVSVLTPVYNTAAYLEECIQGVLAQTYGNFEYLIVDNQSTDGTRAIAERYAALDRRIRVVANPTFLDQLANFNRALELANPAAKYVKYALADDVLFPLCLERMVDVAEAEPAVGMVGSYYYWGTRLAGAGVPRGMRRLGGREALRLMLVDRLYMLGSPTSVLYRADTLRGRNPCFTPGRLHADTELAYEALLQHDFGFAHEILSFIRTDNDSISTRVRDFRPNLLDRLIVTERFAGAVLPPREADPLRARIRTEYYRYLAWALFRFRPARFWRYHRDGLATVGLAIRPAMLLPGLLREVARLLLNPLSTVLEIARALRAPRGTEARPTPPGESGAPRAPSESPAARAS